MYVRMTEFVHCSAARAYDGLAGFVHSSPVRAYLQGFLKLASAHAAVDQDLKHAVVWIPALLPKLPHHIQGCLCLVQPTVALQPSPH